MGVLGRNRRKILTLALAALCGAPLIADQSEERLIKRAGKLVSTIENIQIEDSSRIPASILKEAKGIIILRQFEAGFVFGGKGGYGVALKRNGEGDWGPPAWIKTGEGSWGLQIGAQSLNVALLIMKEEGMDMLAKARFRIGVDASATAGPTGSNVEAKIGADTVILAYTDTEGLYAGATFEGGFLLPDYKANLTTYDEWLDVPEIISHEDVVVPAHLEAISALLEGIEIEEE